MFAIILIVLSLVFLVYSVFICRKMILSFTRSVHRRAGHIMLSLIIVFLVGYLIYIGFSYNDLFTNFLVSLIFFLSAFFIMLVLQVNHALIIRLTMKSLELKDFSEKLLHQTQSLSSRKQQLETIRSMLEQKNQELTESLKKVSSWRLEAVRKMSQEEKQEGTQPSRPEYPVHEPSQTQ